MEETNQTSVRFRIIWKGQVKEMSLSLQDIFTFC